MQNLPLLQNGRGLHNRQRIAFAGPETLAKPLRLARVCQDMSRPDNPAQGVDQLCFGGTEVPLIS